MKRTTTEQGYGWSHQQERERVRKAMEANGGAFCWRCHELILPTDAWDLGHDDDDRSVYRGPEHRACNRATNRRHRDAGSRRLSPALRAFNFDIGGCIYVEALGGFPEDAGDNRAVESMREAEGRVFLSSKGRRLTPVPGEPPAQR